MGKKPLTLNLNRHRVAAWGVSIGAHLLLLFWLVSQPSVNPQHAVTPEPALVLNSYLYQAPRPSTTEPTSNAEPLASAVEPSASIIEPSAMVEKLSKSIDEPVAPEQDIQDPPPELKEAVAEPTPASIEATQSVYTTEQTTRSTAARLMQGVRRAQQQQTEEFINQGSRELQQQWHSPALSRMQTDGIQLTATEEFMKKQQVKVNCDSTTAKVFAVLSGISGGNLKCSQLPEIQGFIDKRVNKEQ